MRMWLLISLAASCCLACSFKAGPAGPQGPPGPAGITGPPGAPGPAKSTEPYYADANGQFVGRDYEYIDAQGMMWYVDQDYGVPLQLPVYTAPQYLEADCAGQAYLEERVLPRWPFVLLGESAYRVRPDTMQSAPITLLSHWDYSGCTNEPTPRASRGFAVTAETVPAMPIHPPANFAAPLREVPE